MGFGSGSRKAAIKLGVGWSGQSACRFDTYYCPLPSRGGGLEMRGGAVMEGLGGSLVL